MILESVLIVLLINALGLVWCYTQQSDKATDLFYSFSFLVLVSIAWFLHADSFVHHLMFGMIALWSLRLGAYLFQRIHKMGKDDRFDTMRKRFSAIAGFWTLQALSVLILSVPIIVLFQKSNIAFEPLHGIAVGLWVFGFLLETIADQQKFVFRNDPNNEGQFVQVGLWKVVQHPNYLGEILCWVGVFLLTVPSLVAWEWLAIVSPLWIAILLIFISGIPLLRRSSEKRYGHLESYWAYRKKTAVLVPFLF